ncbi:DUF779 domain-containing protein [Aequorivita echinoideorum]|uniref:DUF779 domain-containing protein n=1 Tax=Aequorivita echinoideorum TaxID=1549647 RepID=A0ABS5S4V9_9FLAO|nr:DUF779 domain-containing protein [Aequorivita echinoideorum]MBT0607455.1 DUF779 domain-containing protein [Aequorivita echinoideorum]
MKTTKVAITDKAAEVLNSLKETFGDLIFHQSGGCCDGSAPMLLQKDDLYLDESDVLLGQVEGVNFYMNKDQYEYWKHTHLTIDITKGRGASFSLEIPLGYRFLIISRLFTEAEQKEISVKF